MKYRVVDAFLRNFFLWRNFYSIILQLVYVVSYSCIYIGHLDIVLLFRCDLFFHIFVASLALKNEVFFQICSSILLCGLFRLRITSSLFYLVVKIHFWTLWSVPHLLFVTHQSRVIHFIWHHFLDFSLNSFVMLVQYTINLDFHRFRHTFSRLCNTQTRVAFLGRFYSLLR